MLPRVGIGVTHKLLNSAGVDGEDTATSCNNPESLGGIAKSVAANGSMGGAR